MIDQLCTKFTGNCTGKSAGPVDVRNFLLDAQARRQAEVVRYARPIRFLSDIIDWALWQPQKQRSIA